jgi:CRP-like cAMP-binding protein
MEWPRVSAIVPPPWPQAKARVRDRDGGVIMGGMKPVELGAQIFAELRQAYLFADADDAELARLCRHMQPLSAHHGETLFRHGQPATRFFFVRRGQVKLFRVSPDGHEKIIEIIRPGQTFAEAVMFMGTEGRYPVNGEAITDCELFAFDQQTFLQVLRDSHDIGLGMLASMSRRLHMLVNQIDSLTLQNATYRVVMYLLELAPREARPGADIDLAVPKSALASRLAIQPETFSRLLARLRDQGLIEIHGQHVILRDVSGLRELVYLPAAEPPRLG